MNDFNEKIADRLSNWGVECVAKHEMPIILITKIDDGNAGVYIPPAQTPKQAIQVLKDAIKTLEKQK